MALMQYCTNTSTGLVQAKSFNDSLARPGGLLGSDNQVIELVCGLRRPDPVRRDAEPGLPRFGQDAVLSAEMAPRHAVIYLASQLGIEGTGHLWRRIAHHRDQHQHPAGTQHTPSLSEKSLPVIKHNAVQAVPVH